MRPQKKLRSSRRVFALAFFALLAFATLTVSGTASASPYPGDGYPEWRGKLINVNSGKCLVMRAGYGERPVQQYTCGNYSDQVWEIWRIGNGRYWLYSPANRLCVVTRWTGETRAAGTGCSGSYADQHWFWLGRSDDNHQWENQFVNDNSRLCLVVRGASNNAYAVQATCGGWNDQWWKMSPSPNWR